MLTAPCACVDCRKAVPESFGAMLSNAGLWSALHYASVPPFGDGESFGFGQPGVRRAAWVLVQTVLSSHRGECSAVDMRR